MMNIQQSAPMAAAPSIEQSNMPTGLASAAASPIIPLNSPTQMPDQPITFGSNYGPGPGPSVLGLSSPGERTVSQILSELAQYDTTGEVNALRERAELGGF
jgi:hypothetical protein